METIIKGISASKGYALGEVFLLKKEEIVINTSKISDFKAEIEKWNTAKAQTEVQLKKLYDKALVEVGAEHAEIFNVHIMMLSDIDYNENITMLIESEMVTADNAVSQTGEVFSQMFSTMDDEYMKARSADVLDISKRIVKNILNITDSSLDDVSQPVIIVCEDLYPSDTVALDKSKILAFITEKGSKNSHTAILARTLGIPAIVDVANFTQKVKNNDFLIIDGSSGDIILNPTEFTKQDYIEKDLENKKRIEDLSRLHGVKSSTKDGRHIEICANIGNVSDVNLALENDAEGVGLFRTEFIYMESSDFPTEEQQFEIYKTVLSKMGEKRVVIRTLDLGADKHADYFKLPLEENPAMGYRAIRICLNERHIFKTQLRALFRASVFGKLAIMFPMIISESEILEILDFIKEIKAELTVECISFSENIEVGVMIETPASAMISDKIAPHVDFFSIGTNDLTQYTLAVDRMNSKISNLYDYSHPAVLRLMKMSVDNAHAHGVWVGICGESGGDTSLTDTYIAMGIDELSCSPKLILEVREKIISANAQDLTKKITF
ncbi:MAG: phosphoenolpyruvate--protein phosphotransferase [Clostridia bacterium]